MPRNDDAALIHRWAADECRRQHAGKDRVQPMVDAFEALARAGRKFSERDMLAAAALIEPRNSRGYRRTTVTFANMGPSTAPGSVSQAMSQLFRFRRELTPLEFCREFLRIHPFEDGNGRLAACMFNALCRTRGVRLPDFRF
ncbi:MAG: hypothetical protein GY871_01855 [Actinomycetales bacterium]|nr:hypothetical protein [Actinomycetales bacterium]